MTALSVRGLSVDYGAGPVLDDLDLEVPSGAVAAVLGPSGSGKTTLLRVLAGFLRPATGTVRFGQRWVAGPAFVPPERRRVGIVPQEGALFGHLNVRANVGFGLPRGSRKRVDEMLDMVGMRDFALSRPQDLSGGQQQRVALARALAPAPEVVLLDEPFSSLDAALRTRLRAEVRDLLRSIGTTAVLVTHDQEEALSTADLVAVMRDGRIVQSGTPAEVYDAPTDLEVARFVGDAVELPAVLDGDTARCALGGIAVHAHGHVDSPAVLVLRPEQLLLGRPATGHGARGVVREVVYHGYDSLVRVELADGTRVRVRVPAGTVPPAEGGAVAVTVRGLGRIYPDPGRFRGGAAGLHADPHSDAVTGRPAR
ncbi:MAG: ABC transporter ATP-binding protein [Mycobacterium sp.]|nr:ABC transporter ATP-binding protein [Mycobacterium sp.]